MYYYVSYYHNMNKNNNQNNNQSENEVCIMPKNIPTYIGTKGYTILKSNLSIAQLNFIRIELLIRPFVMGSPVASINLFSVYRESDKKIYMPRYFGEFHFGPAKEVKIPNGVEINVPFVGELRDYQQDIVSAYTNKIMQKEYGGGLIDIGCGKGKTVCALNIISQLKLKTIVIVHKEFLMNQWIERAQQYLPNAKIGKIQGQIIDIEGKDIVLAMLQSLSMKEYPATLFDEFGLTIIDEVHHISSEVFSRSLFKLATKYTLGLSATMDRKDGTTKVFKMFLGEVVYKDLNKSTHQVVVRAIKYETQDEDFNKMVYDFRGNPQYSTMISKLCTYNHRTEFILKILTDMLVENPHQQIIILAHNKNILKYLFDAIEHRNITSVGYYVGGMKELALKMSETKKVIIATYSMAAEALDIKTLTTLIMATPKTDIVQSVGRILRDRDSSPVVVDIIDSHDIFKNQWIKRKRFYKDQNYKIVETTNTEYTTNINNWSLVYTPSSKCKSKKNETNDVKTKDDILVGTCFIKLPRV